ncbi:MAG: dihydrolipoyl dehydrogenase [Planctomycetota bacterium]
MAETTAGRYDVAIVGGGPGGYVAAIRASQLGLKTALVEKDPKPGGTCLHRGCIPTKALLQTASVLDSARDAKAFGVKVEGVSLDLPAANKFKDGVVQKNAAGVEFLLKKNSVQTFRGRGELLSPNRIQVQDEGGKTQTIEAAHIVLATGSVPSRPGFLKFDHPRIITSDEALKLTEVPRHVTVLGAGAVGCEFASVWASFGAQVVIVEMLDRLLPIEDRDCSEELQRAFKRRNIDYRVATKLEKAEPHDQGVELLLVDAKGQSEKLSTDLLLCAVGRSPYTEGLGLQKVGIAVERGFVSVDGAQRTRVPSVYAIGDIVGSTPLLAHVASAEGIVAVESIAGKKPPAIDPKRIPSATYCHPEVASIGLTEAQAVAAGHQVKTSKFPFSALGKGGILRARHGFFKLVADERYGEILGVHILGDHATDLISEACALLGLEATDVDLAHIIHPHPTLGEGMLEAAHGLVGGAIHF